MNDKNICGAKTKKGTPCKNAPVEGRERCHLHGGRQPRGPDHHNYKNGLYSKYAGDSLKNVLDEMDDVSTEDLVQPDYEIKLMQALILKSKALEENTGELEELEGISKVVDRLVKAKQRYQAIMIEQDRLIPLNDIRKFFSYMEELLLKRIDEDIAHDILKDIKNFKISDNATN